MAKESNAQAPIATVPSLALASKPVPILFASFKLAFDQAEASPRVRPLETINALFKTGQFVKALVVLLPK